MFNLTQLRCCTTFGRVRVLSRNCEWHVYAFRCKNGHVGHWRHFAQCPNGFHRLLHTSCRLLGPPTDGRSKVDDLLKTLREELEAKDKLMKENNKMQQSMAVKKKQSLGLKIVDELKHYYHGFRLLYVDVKVATRLIGRVLKGETMLRKERRQLVRTTSDIFRLVPFLIFIIVPFMEFALPIFLKLFPNMLPSTFKEESKEREKMNQALKSRLEMAKFLQETLEEFSVERKKIADGSDQLTDFNVFLKRVRQQGGYVSNEELLKYSKLFEDELTLDSLSQAQLRALCLIVGIQPIGASNMLRFQLRLKLRELKADDRMISREGVESLSVGELQNACRARGMRALGLPESQLRSQLVKWLALSLNDRVPPSLLLLSSTLYLPEEVPFSDRLKTIIATLPPHIAEEAKVRLAEFDGARVDNKTKYDLVLSIEEALQKEAEEEAKIRELQAKTALQEKEEEEKTKVVTTIEKVVEPISEPELLVDKAPLLTVEKGKKAEKPIDASELLEIEQLVETVKGQLVEAKEDLEELKEQIVEHQEDVQEVRTIVEHKGQEVYMSKAAMRLQNQVNRLVERADSLIGKLESVDKAVAQHDSMPKSEKKMVMVHEILAALKNLKTVPDEAKRRRVLEVLQALDDDRDGAIDLELALKVIDLMVKESAQVSSEQVNLVMEVLKKEGLLEDEEEKVISTKPTETVAAKKELER